MRCEILDEWDELLDCFPDENQDVYFTKKYISLYEDTDHKALCVSCKDGECIMIMPFLRGEIEGYYDFETAYGYGGPIANTDDLEWSYEAFSAIYDHFIKNGYVCGFIRFHPLLCNEKLIKVNEKEELRKNSNSIQIVYDRKTIAIDTSKELEEIWEKQICSKNRNMIRKAEKHQLKYKSEYDFSSYDEFIDLYIKTMRRLSADDFYFFDRSYFMRLRENLMGHSFLGTVRKDGKLICAAIFMYSECYGHYHLEGSDSDYSSFGANNYLLWKAACEMHELGIKEFHLGGGTGAQEDDSLYRFKKKFSFLEKSFLIGKAVFDRDAYLGICKKWESRYPEKVEKYGNRLQKYKY